MAARRALLLVLGSIAIAAIAACSSSGGSTSGDGSSGSSGGSNGDPSSSGGTFDPSNPDSGEQGGPCAPSPANVEIPGNGCDDDGNGVVDDAPTCDTSLDVEGDAASFARAIGLCGAASATSWGLVSARYVNGFTRTTPPADGQHGILGRFGTAVNPREGASLGVLSSTSTSIPANGPSGSARRSTTASSRCSSRRRARAATSRTSRSTPSAIR